jgi:hypothetical protein
VIVALINYPISAVAAPAAGSPYYTDVTNSYVQDQTSQIMRNLNNILCFMGAMAPDLVVNGGNYIALVDKNICEEGGSGGQSTNQGADYTSVVVNSSRASNNDPMIAKAWLEFTEGISTNKISVYASATQAPSTTLPYGIFRMDYCGKKGVLTNCLSDRGFIDASSTGLAFYSAGIDNLQVYSTALRLNASSNTAGSGIAQDVNPYEGDSTFTFAYNANYFVRSDETGANPQCFDRSQANAKESVWRYGLYDATTGERIDRNSGFPIEYTDAGTTYNGYIGYYGLWTQGPEPTSGATVQQVNYGANGATKVPYTLQKTGGKLHKYTTATRTLAQLDKITFWYFAPVTIPASGTAIMDAGSQYELYWDNTGGTFKVSGKQDFNSGNMVQ